jgi:hypothetical protein
MELGPKKGGTIIVPAYICIYIYIHIYIYIGQAAKPVRSYDLYYVYILIPIFPCFVALWATSLL